MKQKNIKTVVTAKEPHMVGDGFKVQGFIDQSLRKDLSPFFMLDYNAPWHLLPSQHPRGVDVHPHKGFETVTILWDGVLAHEDSSGGKGTLGKGDVQWMTAGKGILHKEFHELEFTKKGGTIHMAQLWVNLPAKFKNENPGYQDLREPQFPRIALDEKGSELKLIAGSFRDEQGPAKTFTRINIYDTKLQAASELNLEFIEGDNTAIIVLKGHILVNGEQQAREGQMLVLEQAGQMVHIESNNEAHFLVLNGEPINEPIAAYGPFVMNTQEEIMQALQDFREGKMGTLN